MGFKQVPSKPRSPAHPGLIFHKERLALAHQILDGIPESYIDLDGWYLNSEILGCGAICCAGGWLSLHPEFNRLGLTPYCSSSSKKPIFPLHSDGSTDFSALGSVFCLETDSQGFDLLTSTREAAKFLFDSAGHGDWDGFLYRWMKRHSIPRTDKNLALARLKVAYYYFSE